MNLPNPRNVNEARRQILCQERARQILDAGYTFWKDEETQTVAVCKPNRLPASYWIYLEEGRCDCPDFAKHKDTCKHIQAFCILESKREEMDALCARYEEAYANDEGAFSTNYGGALW